MYLESDTTSGNFKDGITKFIVTTCPLQFTHCTEMRFLRHCLWKSIVTFTPSNSVLCGTLQNTAQYKDLHRIFGSTLLCISLQFSQSTACFSLHTHDMSA